HPRSDRPARKYASRSRDAAFLARHPLARQYPTNTRTIATSTPDSTPPSYVTDPARPPGGTTARARERTTPTHGAGDRMFHAPARRAGRRLVAALRARGRSL